MHIICEWPCFCQRSWGRRGRVCRSDLKNISHRLCLQNLRSQIHGSGGLSTHSSQPHACRTVDFYVCGFWLLKHPGGVPFLCLTLPTNNDLDQRCLPWLFEALGSPLLVKRPTVCQDISTGALLWPTSPYTRLYLRFLINNPTALRLEARSRPGATYHVELKAVVFLH